MDIQFRRKTLSSSSTSSSSSSSSLPMLMAIVLSLGVFGPGSARGFEIHSPASLVSAMGPEGSPLTLNFRQVSAPLGVGPGGYPAPSRTAAVRTTAVLAGSGLAVDDCAAMALDNASNPARGKVMFALGRGFAGENPLCSLGDKEAIAASLGATALVVVDTRDRVYDAPIVVTGIDIGRGMIPVWVVGNEAGMVIVNAILSGETVELSMYQEPLTSDAMRSLGTFLTEGESEKWSVPDDALIELLKLFRSPFAVDAMITDGTIPYALCTLAFLVRCTPRGQVATLSITGMPMHSALPESIGLFTGLEVVHAELTDLRPPLPAALGKLTRLRSLAITNNPALVGSPAPDLSALANLWELKLEDNGLSGPFPDVSRSTSLRMYDVSRNAFEGAPPTMGTWAARLDTLALSGNRASGPLDPTGSAFVGLQQLRILYFDNNRLTGAIPPGLASLPALVSLRIGGNLFTGPFPPALATSEMRSLRELKIDGSSLDSPLPPITGLRSLLRLDLSRCGLRGSLPAVLPPSLEVLDASYNNFTAMAPVASWSGMKELRELYLRGNQIEVDTSTLLSHLPLSSSPSEGISILDLRDNRLHSRSTAPYVLLDLSLLTSLREAYFGGNPFQGQWIWLARGDAHGSLRIIDASRCPGLVGPVQDNIASFPSLRTFDIRGTAMSANIFADGIYASPRGDGVRADPSLFGPSDVGDLRDHALASLESARSTITAANEPVLHLLTFSVARASIINATDAEAAAGIETLYDLVSLALGKAVEIDPGPVLFDRERGMWCPQLRAAGTSSGGGSGGGSEKLSILADDTYHNRALCTCGEGYVRVRGNQCFRCPPRTVCPGLENQLDMAVEPGFYPTPDPERPLATVACTSTVLSASPCNPDGAAKFACREGYTGRLCSQCVQGYFSRNGLCFKCDTYGVGFVGVLGIFLAAIVATFVLRLVRAARPEHGDAASHARHVAEAAAIDTYKRNHQGEEGPVDRPMRIMTIISSGLFYFQTLSLSMDGFELPRTLAVLKELYDLTNLSVSSLGASCLVGRLEFRDSFLLAWTVPVAILILIWICAAVVIALGSNKNRRDYVRVTAGMTLVIVSLVYFPMSVLTLSALNCTSDPVTGVSYLVRNPAVRCDAVSAAVKWIPVLIYPVGGLLLILALLGVIVRRKATAGANTVFADVVPRFAGWFFLSFQDRYYLLPVLFFARRLLVAAAVALLARDSAVRYALVALVIIASSAVVMTSRPYRTTSANRLDSIALTGAASIFVCSFIAANDEFKTTSVLIVVIFIIHLTVLAAFAAAVFNWVRSNARRTTATKVARYGGSSSVINRVLPIERDIRERGTMGDEETAEVEEN